jgi:hypothetical protein
MTANSDEEEIEIMVVRVFVRCPARSFPQAVVIDVKDTSG